MLSRVAETIYWVGRYMERAENTARLLSVNGNLMLDLPGSTAPGWEPLIELLGLRSDYGERHSEFTERRVVHFLLADQDNPASVIASLSLARENMRTIREILPREAWEYVNDFHHWALQTCGPNMARKDRSRFLDRAILSIQTLTGLLAGTMNHDRPYAFLNIGRKIERADMTTRIVDIRWNRPLVDESTDLSPFDDLFWMTILKSLSGYQMYRQSMHTRINREDVLAFLFQRPEFPRALPYCLETVKQNLATLPNSDCITAEVEDICETLRLTPVTEMEDAPLHAYIDDLQLYLGHLHDMLCDVYFGQATNRQTALPSSSGDEAVRPATAEQPSTSIPANA